MGLDVEFDSIKRTEVGSFRKNNFFLTYFGVTDDDNAVDIEISLETFGEFVADLKCEILQFKERSKQYAGCVEIPPINPRFYSCEVPFGGSTLYDEFYWGDLHRAYDWAIKVLRDFDWDGHKLVLNCNW